ncbi:MAG: DUF1848 domain-containing protein [Methanomicrobiaceae archaeon]|nr:DUF1848 domain-containing protein [Methanomicrobiaceae archaeon]
MNSDFGKEPFSELKPVIVSASRATDIPAFYSEWFINRLKKGYLIKLNPYNQKPYRINFENTKFIVFWTKNPKPMIPYLNYLDEMGIDYYFQFTLNDYEREGYEKNVPPLSERIDTFKQLSEIIGKEKIIWRFDPLILSDRISPETLIERTENIGCEISDYTERLVFSFFDMYRSVSRNLQKTGNSDVREFNCDEMTEFSDKLSHLNQRWNLSLFTCGEVTDLSKYGIFRGRCIDPELVRRISYNNPGFLEYLAKNSSKDKNQRPFCGCIPSTDIGQYNTCIHECLYCYATRNTVMAKEFYRHILKNPESESLIFRQG